MKLSALIVAAFALPAALANTIEARTEAPPHVIEARQLEARTFIASGRCDMFQAANCFVAGRNMDANCNCVAPPFFQLPTPACGSYTTYRDPVVLSKCWSNGQGCGPFGNCIGTPVTPPPTSGTCNNWVQISICEMLGKKTDGNCQCVGGTPVTPGNAGCGDPSIVGNCYKQKYGCSSKCVCTPNPTTTSKAPATTTTVTPGACQNWVAIASCELRGLRTDGNCNCVGGTPVTPGNNGCGDPNIVGNCYKQGWGCSSKCVCTPLVTSSPAPTTTTPAPTTTTKAPSPTTTTKAPSPTTTTPVPTVVPGICWDWFKIATCAQKGMKTDGNCNCVGGTPVTPGNNGCGDPAIVGECWRKGWGCSSKCVCTGPSTTITPSTTVTATPTATPTQVGQCKDAILIKWCALTGRGVNPDCTCISCGCTDQWACHAKGGKLDSNCKCVVPSSAVKRRDAEWVKSLCPTTMKACRVDGEESGFNGRFECIDITSNIESCGGCVGEGQGQDCTSIEGASDVGCVQSKCVVTSCQRGWELSADGRCTPATNGSKFQQKVWGV